MKARRADDVSEDEYLAREQAAATKSEWIHGAIVAMAGVSPRHNAIAANVIGALGTCIRDRPCVVLTSDQRVCVESTRLYTYPDAVVACPPIRMHPKNADTLLNPTLIVEVLSPSTEGYDRGAKFAHYRRLASLREYVLVAQLEKHVEVYYRREGGAWELKEWTDDGDVRSEVLECVIPMAEIYAKTELFAPDDPPA